MMIVGVIVCLGIATFADETSTTVTLTVSDNGITFASTASGSVNYSASSQTKAFTGASNANGAVTYSIVSQKNSGGTTVSSFSIANSGTPTMTIASGTSPGTYTIVLRASAAGDSTHIPKSIDQTYTLTIGKMSNAMTFTSTQSGSVTFSTTAQARSFTAASNANGAVTYSITSQKNSSNTTVNYFSIPTASTASFNVAANTPAGTYTIGLRASAAGDSTHNSGTKDATYTLTVNKANGSVSLSATTGTIIYPNTGTFTVSSNTSGGTLSVSSATTSVATASISGTNVTITPAAVTSDGGTSVITVTSAATANYNSASATYTVTVNRGTITLTPTAKNSAYTGSAQYAQVKSNVAGVTIVSGSSTSYGNSITTNATANTNYNLLPGQTNVTSAQTVYYKASKAGYKDATGSTTVTITKAGSSVATAPSAKSGLTYTGSAQTLVNAASGVSGGTVYYGIGSSTTSAPTSWSTNLPEKTDAGTYYIWYKVTGDSNHSDVAATYATTATIGRASVGAKPTNTNVSRNYTGSAQNNGYTTPANVTMTGNNSGTNAGEYTATYTPNANYQWSDGTNGSVVIKMTINQVAGTVSYAAQSWNPTFATTSQTKTLAEATNSNGTVTYSLVSQKSGSSNVNYFTFNASTRVLTMAANAPAGTYTVVVRASDAGDVNHTSSTADSTITITVGKATNTNFTMPTTQTDWNLDYSTSAQNHTINSASGAIGTVSYALSGTGSNNFSISSDGKTLTMNSDTPVGTYNITITATDAGDANHNAVSKTSTIKVVVSKAENPVVFPETQIETFNYDSTTRTITLNSATDGQGTITYSIISQPEGNYFSLNGNILTVAQNAPVGNHQVVIRATAAGNDKYESAFKDMTLNLTIEGTKNVVIPSEIDLENGGTISYELVGYKLDIAVSSENGFKVVNGTDQIPYTMNTSMTNLVNTGSVDLEFTLNGNPSYSGNYQDILNFEMTFSAQ